jgi:hypothetical protein
MKKRLMLVGALIGVIHSINVQAAVTLDFSTSDGGMTATGLWQYSAGTWFNNGYNVGGPATEYLTTPTLTVNASGQITGSFIHRFYFENNIDGGQIQYQVNGGGWNTVSGNLITGQSYVGQMNPSVELSGQYSFTGESSGFSDLTPSFVTSSFTLGTGSTPYDVGGSAASFNAGDTVKFRFLAAWDDSTTLANPNWQVSSLSFNNLTAVPEPATTAAAVSGLLAAFAMLRRPSVRAKLGALIGR